MALESPPRFRRAFTLPTHLQRSPSPASPSPNVPANAPNEHGAETLFAHSHARIVKFPAPPPGSAHKDGTLPWTKPNERIEAAGVLRLYKFPGQSVAFLHSGDMLLSLLSRSQCWCVDGSSKFALRLQMFVYRIELPYETEQNRACVEDFKIALSKVLRYERTPCPFKRSFSVEVEDEVDSPLTVKRLTRSNTKARKWAYDAGWRPEGQERPTPPEGKRFDFGRGRRRRSGSSSAPASDDEGGLSNANSHETLSTQRTSVAALDTAPYVVGQVKRLESTRVVSEPSRYNFDEADPFRTGDGEEDSLKQDVAPSMRYIPLGAVHSNVDGSQADAAAQEMQAAPEPVHTFTMPEKSAGTFGAFGTLLAGHDRLPEDVAESSDETGLDIPAHLQENFSVNKLEKDDSPQTEPVHSNSPSSPEADSPLQPQTQYGFQSKNSTTWSLQTFRTAPSTFNSSPANSPPTDDSYFPHSDSIGRADPAPPSAVFHGQPSHDPPVGGKKRNIIFAEPPPTPSTPAFITRPILSEHTSSPPTSATQITPPSSPHTTVKPRPSQMLRTFRSRRPSTPSKNSTATARGLGLDLSNAHYLRNDPLPIIPYDARNQGVVGATLGLLLGPPSGLVQVMMQIAARIGNSTPSLASSMDGQAQTEEMGEVYYRHRKGLWVPGGWDDSDGESAVSSEGDEFVEAVEGVGGPLGVD